MMEIWQGESRLLRQGAANWFTGQVIVEPLMDAKAPARASVAAVTFAPSARTAWHTHPLGQTLIVTAGAGLVQSWGASIRAITVGDVVWIPPHEKHWHGAAPTTGMSHIAIHEALDGKAVDWMELVSDEQYPTN